MFAYCVCVYVHTFRRSASSSQFINIPVCLAQPLNHSDGVIKFKLPCPLLLWNALSPSWKSGHHPITRPQFNKEIFTHTNSHSTTIIAHGKDDSAMH